MSDFKITRGDGVEEECTYVNQTTPLAESSPAPQPEGTMDDMPEFCDHCGARRGDPGVKCWGDHIVEPPVPPAGARETPEQFYEEWIKTQHTSADNRRSFFRFAEAYAASERARADGWWKTAQQERARADKAERRLATFEDEHKRFLILSQTVVDRERELREMREALTEMVRTFKGPTHDETKMTIPNPACPVCKAEALLSRKDGQA